MARASAEARAPPGRVPQSIVRIVEKSEVVWTRPVKGRNIANEPVNGGPGQRLGPRQLSNFADGQGFGAFEKERLGHRICADS
jgi:hypothetical protein